MVGSESVSAASRSHIAVSGVVGPSERYSAMPSMNQSGGWICSTPWSAEPAAPVREHVQLELVGHLVREHVIDVGVRAGQRHDVPLLEEVGEAAGAFADVARGRVGLLEIGVRGVEDDHLPLAEAVPQHAREPRVGALRHARRVHRRDPLSGIEVNVEVFGLDDLPVEGVVLHLVLAEVLRRRERGRAEQTGAAPHRNDEA